MRTDLQKRNFLFLQGVCSPFFKRLAAKLTQEGHSVCKVNFNAGDWLYWNAGRAYNFKGTPTELPDFLERIYRMHGITDQVLFGDKRPIHSSAISVSRLHGINNHVFEEGYFRPFWLTLEREGVNGHSLLPQDPDWFRRAALHINDNVDGSSFSSSFAYRAYHDFMYHAVGFWNPVFFNGYKTHAPHIAPIEYAAYLKRKTTIFMVNDEQQKKIGELINSQCPYYLLPLQLDSDAQIRFHSRFSGMNEVIFEVLASFSQFAPSDAKLIIKNHPLDSGLYHYASYIKQVAQEFGILDRVHYFEVGDLHTMIQAAVGVVTVNSTVGSFALGLGAPTKVLGNAIYNLEGLADQKDLDSFWSQPLKPDMHLFNDFRRTVMYATQVNGSFYCPLGTNLSIKNCSRILTAELSPLQQLLSEVPVTNPNSLPYRNIGAKQVVDLV